MVTVGIVASFVASAQEGAMKGSQSEKTPSVVVLTPDRIDFGSQVVGVAGQPKSATLTNTGNSLLTISDITASGIDFSETNTCPPSLAAGAACTIDVTFRPASNQARLGTVIISDSGPGSPHMLLLSGIGQ
jgi:hypothetical protein